jgi:hypothetical protein
LELWEDRVWEDWVEVWRLGTWGAAVVGITALIQRRPVSSELHGEAGFMAAGLMAGNWAASTAVVRDADLLKEVVIGCTRVCLDWLWGDDAVYTAGSDVSICWGRRLCLGVGEKPATVWVVVNTWGACLINEFDCGCD